MSTMLFDLRTRVYSLTENLVRMYRDTNALHLSWYIHWYRFLVRAFVESAWRRIDQRRGLVKSKLGPPSTDAEFSDDCGRSFSRLCHFLSSKRRFLIKVVVVLAALFLIWHGIRYFCYVTELHEHVDTNAAAGYFQCQVDEAQVANFDKNYACDFSPQPNPSHVIIVTFINSAFISLTKNWICSAEKVGLKDKLFLVGFEPGVCSKVSGVPCYEHPGVSIGGTIYGKPGYQKLMIERTKVILKLLSCGRRVALVDADITFLKDPFIYLDEVMLENDIVFQSDSSGLKVIDSVLPYFFRYICGGFIYMRSSEAIKRLWLSVVNYQNNFKWDDQAGLNVCIRHHTQSVRWNVLDSEYFPNGRQYFFYNAASEKNHIVHANHLLGNDKLIRMVAADLWCEIEKGKEICKAAPNFQRHCISKDPKTLDKNYHERLLIEEAVKNAVNHNSVHRQEVGISHDSQQYPNSKRRKMRFDYDPSLAPEWCERFIQVCRTKFGVEVLE